MRGAPWRRGVAVAAGAAMVLGGVVATAAPASAATPWLVVDESGFATFTVPVGEVEESVGRDVSQIVAEGNFGPSSNWAEFGLTLRGDTATGVVGPLEPGAYYYQVTADDQYTVKDPTNPTSVASEPEWSTFVVAGEGAELLVDAPEGARGEVRELTYRSSVAGEDRAALAWTPPDYDAERAEPYPVLYLQHGGGQGYRDWVEVGRAGQILDNLYAAGDIAPMVVVMGDGNVRSFPDELLRNITRAAERQLNISSDPAQRALAGLSMGGGQAFEVLRSDPGAFSHVGTFGAGRFDLEDLPVEEINAGTDLLRLYVGNQTDIAYNDVHTALEALDAAGVEHQFDGAKPDAGHNWDAWQEDLVDFSQRLFQDGRYPGLSPGHELIEEPFTPTAPEDGSTPWISEDGFVTFETTTDFADAEHVTVWANWGPSNLWLRVELSKAGDRWRGTVGPLEPGWYHYRLIVDMQSVKDTRNPTSVTSEPTWSQFLVPGGAARVLTPVPEDERGTVQPMTYDSGVAGEERTALVWTPPGFDADRAEPWPVLYLQHGGGQSYTDWPEMGHAAEILDNHLRDGNLEPMVVVMGNGNVGDFTTELLENIAPAAEEQFGVSDDPQRRALAGLSRGGFQTLEVLRQRPGTFGYIGAFSAGLSGDGSDLDVEAVNEGTTLLRLYNGNVTDFTYGSVRSTLELFDRLGVEHEFDGYYEGPHGWDTWQHALVDFAPRLFRQATADDGDGIPVEATVPEEADGFLALTVGGDGGGTALGAASNAGDRLVMAGRLPDIAVTDSRTDAQAGDGGWAVSGQSSDLAGPGGALPAGHLGWTPLVVAAAEGVTAGPSVRTVMSGGAGLAAPQRLAAASGSDRAGTATVTADLRLEVPTSTQPGTYRGAVTVSLFPVD
ncbi:alpha/beta hydrolase [Pseudokineococcus marinus]|uniref:Esterase n=1 Tax=Pseudokineococcus marinus TaxID=351215 RepID=A0A849BTH4_9ACTN|nr:alpha/beta hydrolase-fold protein [Pseudokineococcus marinus]NNH24102.1 esterase [Pseudokineococcus marinus]